jgi:hypothetical protein
MLDFVVRLFVPQVSLTFLMYRIPARAQIENRNDQLRRELMLERTSAPAASDDASTTMDPSSSSSAVSASRRFSPSDGAQNTCTVLVENLILEKGIPAFEATGDPVTLLVVDFFLHDTQTSRPLIGFAPSGRLKLDMEVTVDQVRHLNPKP